MQLNRAASNERKEASGIYTGFLFLVLRIQSAKVRTSLLKILLIAVKILRGVSIVLGWG